eukprot:SAG11_NODE_18568_length_487_cov_0.922680_1_plen_110_part_01
MQVKKKFKAVAQKMVVGLGYLAMFDSVDADGSGELDAAEFLQVARQQCFITVENLSDTDVHDIFKSVDTDGSGEVSAKEFTEWLAADDVKASKHERRVKAEFARASLDAV